ncbi:hypothetical protein SRB5_30260 [Streptomyces sp. RB5]|uniref:Uncharacterized protein n=1 Tax=Streptomyces smaragdinus TaxID=2585196 RepID=A0A7K0CHC6_9ACTN|nr:hypothetical protein [Streptomyces smaragdinus]MQY12887.1 hypothetical protein [Streptomyces smaragdinus]
MTEASRYTASYSPLPETAGTPGPGEREPEGDPGADTRFLFRVAGLVHRLGAEGTELQRIDLIHRRFTFAQYPRPDDRLPVYSIGPVPDDDSERQGGDYIPLAPSPPWTQMTWLLEQLAVQLTFFGSHGARLTGIEAPSRRWADVTVEHEGTVWRARVPLEGRAEPIEQPGMVLAELFGEKRHLAVADGTIIHNAL